jgi:hypothetical protein
VGLDILWAEGWSRVRNTGGLDDYLKEAALADNPPSGTFYDPDGDGTRLQSQGVHERWNNATDRQYSRNLGTGDGIELVYYKMMHDAADLSADRAIDVFDLALLMERWLWAGNPGSILEDIVEDGAVNLQDFAVIADNWNQVYE